MNYFNYFTEVEDHFRQARGSGMFMFSPLDWALIESWKDAGVPLGAVLKGIDRSFEKFHGRRRRHTTVNSIAYCTQEVLEAARSMARHGTVPAQAAQAVSPALERGRLAKFLRERADELGPRVAAGGPVAEVFAATADALRGMAEQAESGQLEDLEAAEQRLSVLEDRLVGAATSVLSEEQVLAARRELDDQLRPYRRKMKAEQIAFLEQRYMRGKCLEQLGLSRLSVAYLK